jgi:hypothetical protein
MDYKLAHEMIHITGRYHGHDAVNYCKQICTQAVVPPIMKAESERFRNVIGYRLGYELQQHGDLD